MPTAIEASGPQPGLTRWDRQRVIRGVVKGRTGRGLLVGYALAAFVSACGSATSSSRDGGADAAAARAPRICLTAPPVPGRWQPTLTGAPGSLRAVAVAQEREPSVFVVDGEGQFRRFRRSGEALD